MIKETNHIFITPKLQQSAVSSQQSAVSIIHNLKIKLFWVNNSAKFYTGNLSLASIILSIYFSVLNPLISFLLFPFSVLTALGSLLTAKFSALSAAETVLISIPSLLISKFSVLFRPVSVLNFFASLPFHPVFFFQNYIKTLFFKLKIK